MQGNLATVIGLTQTGGAAAPPGSQDAQWGGGESTTATEGAPTGAPAGPMGPMGCGGGDQMTPLLMMLAMFVAFYFLLIRPQQKKAKEHQGMLNALQKGDEVVTGGGLIGKITGVQDKIVTLEVSEKVRVRVTKAQIVDKFTK